MIGSRNLLWISMFCLLLLAACGHSRNLVTSTPSGLSEASIASSSEPQWLTDALAELDALERPADVNPQVFSDLKSQLAQLLRDKAAGKIASSISADFTQALNLRFKQDSPEANVYLEWGYVNRGDYDQDGTVDIADVTPVAQQLTNSWFEGDWNPDLAKANGYRSIVAVVDGDLDGVVDYRPPNPPDPGDPGDLLPIAVNFLNSVANYSIYGSDDPENPQNATKVGEMGFSGHEYVGPPGTPPKRLFYRFNVSELPSQHRFAYYWVQPDDGQNNAGAFSDSYWTGWGPPSDATPDPADLRPVISGVSPANYVTWPRETDITFKYSLSDDGPRPAVAQEWDFNGAAAGQTQIFTNAEPTITLTSDIGLYSCTVVAENAYGESEEFDFRINVTSGQSFPVVSEVVQQGFAKEQPATFTCMLSAGPGDMFEWNFAGGAEPNSTTSYTDSVTVTLASVQRAYPGAWVQVTNLEGTCDKYYFTVAVGNPPTGVSAGIPETLVLNEEATFTASYDPSTMPPVTFTWRFGPAGEQEEYVTFTPEITLAMQDGGTQYGSLKVSNARGDVTVGFDFYVHWNELRMRVQPLANGDPDYLFGADGYVTVIVQGYDIGHPLRRLTSVYLEYDKRLLACPLYANLTATNPEPPYEYLFPDEWNLGAIGHQPWYSDGWWQDYGTLFGGLHWLFFYGIYEGNLAPHPSVFEERSEYYCLIAVNLTYLGQYYADVGTYGDFYSFRMYLPVGGGPQPPEYEAEIKNYREGPLEDLITFYVDQNEEVHVFSNEPSIWISVHDD